MLSVGEYADEPLSLISHSSSCVPAAPKCRSTYTILVQDSGFPCFKGGPRTIENLRKRFHLSLTEEVCWLLSS